MEEVYNDVIVHQPDSYNVLIPFTVVQQGQGLGLPPLKGVLFNEARVEAQRPDRLRRLSSWGPLPLPGMKVWI